jgi:hypothetical protein
MSEDARFTIDCDTCMAAATSACTECVVTDVLAGADVPIALTPVAARSRLDEVVALFRHAGLVGDDPQWVEPDEFEAALR